MARVKLDWSKVEFPGSAVSAWKHLKPYADDRALEMLKSKRAVYVIRVKRPFAFQYNGGFSPVAYIGKGDAHARLRSHLSGWVSELTRRIPDIEFQICFCEPTVRYHGTVCEHVESDLINRFAKKFGERPLRNKVTPNGEYSHVYDPAELKLLTCGKGPGYHWGIRPMRSSMFHRGA